LCEGEHTVTSGRRSRGLVRPPLCRRSARTTSDTAAYVSWARIGEAVGHDDITTTSRVYTHVVADEREIDYSVVAVVL
jgi:hypothetical protein